METIHGGKDLILLPLSFNNSVNLYAREKLNDLLSVNRFTSRV
jgi:hypothetical protein